MERGGGFLRLGRVLGQGPAIFCRIFDDYHAGILVGIANLEFALLTMLTREHHQAFSDLHAAVGLVLGVVLTFHVNSGIGGVRQQPPLVTMDALENAFTREGAGFQDVEGTGVKNLAASVLDPNGAKRNMRLAISAISPN